MTRKNMVYTKEQVEWLKENAYGHRHKVLAEMFNERFGTNLTMQQIRRALQTRKIENGLHQHSDMSDEMIKFIYENYKGIGNQELVDRLNEKFGTNFSRKKIKDYKYQNNLQGGIRVHYRREILDETTTTDGYTYVKVDEAIWVRKHRYLYEKYIGKIPEGHVVIFKDGNKQNFDLDNLMLADTKLLGRVASLMTDDEELNEIVILNGKLQNKIEELEKGGSNE